MTTDRLSGTSGTPHGAGRVTQPAGYPHYPFTIAAYSVLSLAAANVSEGTPLSVIVAMLGVTLGATALLTLFVRILIRQRQQAALVVALFVVIGFWFQYIARAIAALVGHRMSDSMTLLAAVTLVIVTAVVAVRRKLVLASLTRYLNVASLLLVAFPVFTLSSGRARAARNRDVQFALPTQAVPAADRERLPDIYLFVLDAYASTRTLADSYGLDNAPFEAALRSRGFIVPQSVRANYGSTFLALASMLSWEYLDTIPALIGRNSTDQTITYRLTQNSRTVRFLKRAGYRFVFFPTTWVATLESKLADTAISLNRTRLRESTSALPAVWLANTVMPVFMQGDCEGECKGPWFLAEDRTTILWKLAQLGRVAALPGPKFVFLHLVAPHEPFVFRNDCSSREPFWPEGRDAVDSSAAKRWRTAYVDQVMCVNQLLLAAIDSIVANSARQPVILLQGDHGHTLFERGVPPLLDRATPREVRERFETFGAYLLPGVSAASVPDTTSPVNLFRIVSNAYFGTGLPLLPNQSYYSPSSAPYAFTRIDTLLQSASDGGGVH